MNQKGFVNIILIAVVVAIIAAGGYFVFIGNSPTPPTAQKIPEQISTQPTQEQTTPKSTEKPEVSPSLSSYSEFFGFPQAFFDGSILSQRQILKGVDAQYLSLKNMHNGIAPYQSVRIEYDSPVYGSTMPNGIKLGDAASPRLNSGHPRWAVMAHEQGHNFFGGTSAFYNTLAVPGPFLQESFAVLSALYTYNNILENQQAFGLDTLTINSLNYDFAYERNYQKSQYNLYISSGKNFNMEDVLTSQALDYKMIVYGETYGWQNYRKLTKAFANGIANQFTFQNDGISDNERSTYIIAALSAVFEHDFRDDFLDLNFPIDNMLYMQIQPKIQNYVK